MKKFKVGDKVKWGDYMICVVVPVDKAFHKKQRLNEQHIPVHIIRELPNLYDVDFPYNWANDRELRLLSKLEQIL